MTDYTLPSDEIMRRLTKMAMEWATSFFAETAEKAAADMRSGLLPLVNGIEALEAFAVTIRQKNAELYPPEGPAA